MTPEQDIEKRAQAGMYAWMLGKLFGEAEIDGYTFEVSRRRENDTIEYIDINWRDSESKSHSIKIWESMYDG